MRQILPHAPGGPPRRGCGARHGVYSLFRGPGFSGCPHPPPAGNRNCGRYCTSRHSTIRTPGEKGQDLQGVAGSAFGRHQHRARLLRTLLWDKLFDKRRNCSKKDSGSKRAGEQKREQKKQMPTDCRHLAWSRRIKKLRYDCKSGRQKRRKQCQTCSKFWLCKNIRKK